MEFKIGGKITLSENKKYYILDIIELDGEKYLFCTTAVGKIKPVVLKTGEIDGKTKVKIEENPVIIRDVSSKILENDDKELLKKITEEN